MVVYEFCGETGRNEKSKSNSGYKKKDAWRLAQAVILFLATYLMSSGPILAFF